MNYKGFSQVQMKHFCIGANSKTTIEQAVTRFFEGKPLEIVGETVSSTDRTLDLIVFYRPLQGNLFDIDTEIESVRVE